MRLLRKRLVLGARTEKQTRGPPEDAARRVFVWQATVLDGQVVLFGWNRQEPAVTDSHSPFLKHPLLGGSHIWTNSHVHVMWVIRLLGISVFGDSADVYGTIRT